MKSNITISPEPVYGNVFFRVWGSVPILTVDSMVSRPDLTYWAKASSYYAMGWSVRPMGDEANWDHNGGLPGTATRLLRMYNGIAWAVLFNSRPRSEGFHSVVNQALSQAVNEVTEWPTHDLFGQYP